MSTTADAAVTERDASADVFRFEARSLWTENGNDWHVLVPFTGSHDEFEWAVKNVNVSARTHTEPTDDSPRIVELRGSISVLSAALAQYAQRAIPAGSYSLGDLFQHGRW